MDLRGIGSSPRVEKILAQARTRNDPPCPSRRAAPGLAGGEAVPSLLGERPAREGDRPEPRLRPPMSARHV